jgi:ribosome-associated protein
MHEPEDLEQGGVEGPSKSQLKREMHALQDLAKRLVALPRAELEHLDLSASTWAAIDETSRIKDLRALRRHHKRIAKLLAQEDTDAVHALMHEKDELARKEAARHHRVERWRERLIEEGDDALRVFLEQVPGADRQQLRSLMRAAQRDRDRGKPESARKLFRALRDALDGGKAG